MTALFAVMVDVTVELPVEERLELLVSAQVVQAALVAPVVVKVVLVSQMRQKLSCRIVPVGLLLQVVQEVLVERMVL